MMGTVFLSTTAIGVLKDPEKFIFEWKPVHNWPYSLISEARFSYKSSKLQVCDFHADRCGHRNTRSSQSNVVLRTWSRGIYHGPHSFVTLPKIPLSRWMKARSLPSLYPQVALLKTFLHERETQTVMPEDEEGNEGEDASEDSDGEADCEDIVQETLNLLEWPAICVQVAQFASTPMGISIAREANLIIGANKLQSEEFLEQTAAACALPSPLMFSGIENLQGIIAGAVSGTVCQIKELCSVKETLMGIRSVYEQLCGIEGLYLGSSSPKAQKWTSLQNLMLDCNLCSDLVNELDHCLDCALGTVVDRASPALAAARLGRQGNMRAIEALLKETAAWIVKQGGMDSVIITRRRTRLCIAVRSSHKSLLPGGVILDVSNTGTTSFMEPEPVVMLNNEDIRLAMVEKAEEIAVLKRLTFKLLDKADAIMDLLGRITMVDLACARASHARWLGSVRPWFYNKMELSTSKVMEQDELSRDCLKSSSGETTQGGTPGPLMFDIDGICHPFLLGTVLPELPTSQRLGIIQSSTTPKRLRPQPKVVVVSENLKRPVPIDGKVLSKVRVVTITGPNTGGKTATLKTFGLAAVMAKAGLFLPAFGQPKLPWFDKVLADVGDDQSLERNLSTFSGHIRRLCSILKVCTDESFILLDEVGGGTDPSEGAALATAILQHLSLKVLLTIATTHSAELKTLKDLDPKFENASVEFDVMTLKPTYRILWGIAGQSNALDIAESLGFDNKVLTRAREMVGKLLPSQLGVRSTELLVPIMKQCNELLERSQRAAEVCSKAQKLHHELKQEADNLPKREAAWRMLEEQTVQRDVESAKLRMQQVLDRFQETMRQAGADDSLCLMQQAQAEIASTVKEFVAKPGSITIQDPFSGDEVSDGGIDHISRVEPLAVGEKVLVRKLGKTPVTVIELPPKGNDYLTVRLGALKMQVRSNEVLRINRPVSGSTPTRTEKMLYKTSNQVKSRTNQTTRLEPKYGAAVQTSKNTLDLRGMRVDDAIRELNMTLAGKSPQSVLFVIHGVGTGAVKEGVYQTLQNHPFVAKFEEESIANAGCTIVYVK